MHRLEPHLPSAWTDIEQPSPFVRIARNVCVMRTSGLAPEPDHVQSLERGLSVITAFSAERPSMTLSEVAKVTGLTRAAARRFLLTLQRLGYVTADDRTFSLSPRTLELGYAYLSSTPFWELAQPHMESLVDRLHESSSISVLDGAEIVYVSRVPTKRIMTISLSVGSRLPAYPTSMGRVLLAGLDDARLDDYLERVTLVPLTTRTVTNRETLRRHLVEVREQGWALVDQELEEGVRSIAAPLRDTRSKVVGALNVSAHAARTTLDRLRREFLPALLDTAGAINAALERRR
jgi:IclR family transcriptional regulator, pca regulon regulatory protein